MNNNQPPRRLIFGMSLILFSLVLSAAPLEGQDNDPEIPNALKPWQDWATWNDRERDSPPVFNDPKQRIGFWPSRLKLDAHADSAEWQVAVEVFSESWVPLPGSAKVWPQSVKIGDASQVVVERNGHPAVKLQPGRHKLTGEFNWNSMPQKISVPREIGLLELTVDGEKVSIPNWDASGNIWLRRMRTEAAEKKLLAAQVYRVIEDGIPLWLQTEIELTVSGKSREEELGTLLPDGWTLATVDSPIPVAVGENGNMKAQVRSGKWTIKASAFFSRDQREFQFANSSQPIAASELIAFRAKPDFRLAELTELPTIDAAQTTFPPRWRNLPLYQWDTSEPFGLNEKSRGMGAQQPDGLAISRQIWLDENGQSATYHDAISGKRQMIWRLDAAESQKLGSVRVDGQGQLITANPSSGANGIELRTRDLNLQAVGEIESTKQIPATGWQSDAASLEMSLQLPPGWRALVMLGADEVRGDWLNAWTLLDLFLVLIFSIAVCRIWGIPAGLIAFIAFGLAYHEPGAPRLTWLFLLMPLALLKVVREGAANKWLSIWKYVAATLLIINLVPFLAGQIQTALYPQLERPGVNYQSRTMCRGLHSVYTGSTRIASRAYEDLAMPESADMDIMGRTGKFQQQEQSINLALDPNARIQTGPGQPEWRWNQVNCYWNGPVTSAQTVRPILITQTQHRVLTVVRIVLLAFLLTILLEAKRLPKFFSRSRRSATAAAAAVLIMLFADPAVSSAQAQEIPDQQTLDTLRSRLLEVPDAFPKAAEIPSASLKIDGDRATMQAEVHTAAQVAVPLPGRIPTWTPISVAVDGEPAELIRRKDDYLWVVLPAGVHRVQVETLLPNVTEWEWTFLLPPRRVTVEAPGWNVAGINRNGVPERQVFFARKQQATEGDSSYDRKDFSAIAAVDRHLEIGLVWQVNNVVSRLSSGNKAVSIKVPLLPGEKVLTSGETVEAGQVEVRLGAGQKSFRWKSELAANNEVTLAAADSKTWVERWHVVTSPVWNISYDGLSPVLSEQREMVPVWHPWPGEQVTLTFNRPTAIAGTTTTVHRLEHESTLESRQRRHVLKAEVESSLGGEFLVQLDAEASVSSVTVAGQAVPARMNDGKLVVPIQAGRQSVAIAYRTDQPLGLIVNTSDVTLPTEATNVTMAMKMPRNRWVLWASGPTRGPAVQFWPILIFALIAAFVLGGIAHSPLGRFEWMMLAIGLTQVHVAAALFVVAWLFALAWRGKSSPESTRWWVFNLRQVGLVLMTLISLGILIVAVGGGLLGYPEMFILGNGSYGNYLNWFEPRIESTLPAVQVISISFWFYRLLMLCWALWLSFALIRWLIEGWKSFSHDDTWQHKPKFEPASETIDAQTIPEPIQQN